MPPRKKSDKTDVLAKRAKPTKNPAKKEHDSSNHQSESEKSIPSAPSQIQSESFCRRLTRSTKKSPGQQKQEEMNLKEHLQPEGEPVISNLRKARPAKRALFDQDPPPEKRTKTECEAILAEKDNVPKKNLKVQSGEGTSTSVPKKKETVQSSIEQQTNAEKTKRGNMTLRSRGETVAKNIPSEKRVTLKTDCELTLVKEDTVQKADLDTECREGSSTNVLPVGNLTKKGTVKLAKKRISEKKNLKSDAKGAHTGQKKGMKIDVGGGEGTSKKGSPVGKPTKNKTVKSDKKHVKSSKEPKIKKNALNTKRAYVRKQTTKKSPIKGTTSNSEAAESENADNNRIVLRKSNRQPLASCLENNANFSDIACPPIPIRKAKVNDANFLNNYQSGLMSSFDMQSIRKKQILKYLWKFKPMKEHADFDRRITAIEWHPSKPELVAIASKGGDLKIWDIDTDFRTCHGITGIGAGGSIQAIKFDPWEPNNTNVFVVSMTGEFLRHNYANKTSIRYLNTGSFNQWYLSLDVNVRMRTMAVGDTEGNLTILTDQGKKVGVYRLHKKTKIAHVEFSNREPHIICTASNDKFVKIWDARMLGEADCKPLYSLPHETPINGAVFSKTDGSRLLTTDQDCHINVYRGPLFDLEHSIVHPHRRFQHITSIRADWHPHEDIIVVGRYPDQKLTEGQDGPDSRTIDFFDASSGQKIFELYNNSLIKTINRFNCTGEVLLSAISCDVLLWKPEFRNDVVMKPVIRTPTPPPRKKFGQKAKK